MVVLSFLKPDIVFGQKMFPGATGFGSDSRAAYQESEEPAILIVDNLDPGDYSTGENRGTFLWCITRSYPRIILFEVGGVIDYTGTHKYTLQINDPYLSIYGQTAPFPGITLKSATLRINTHDILIQHLKIRPGDELESVSPNDRDCMTIKPGWNIVIDHCTFTWSVDELVAAGGATGTDNITFSNCIFAEPLNASLHYDHNQPERHTYAVLSTAGHQTFYRNLFAFSYGRNPIIDNGQRILINNMSYTTGWSAPQLGGDADETIVACIIGNVVYPMPNGELHWTSTNHAAYVLAPTKNSASSLYVEDNWCQNKLLYPENTDWDNVWNNERITRATSPQFDLSEYEILPNGSVEELLAKNVGAFNWQRDTVDTRIVSNVINKKTYFLDSPDSLPAILGKQNGFNITNGLLPDGYDWSSDPQSMTLNGQTITLNQNCSDPDEIVNYLNSILPEGYESFRYNAYSPTTHVVGIRTILKGSDQCIEASGSAMNTLGMPEGLFCGFDGVPGWNELQETNNTRDLNIPGNPHDDDNDNGYTNLEEWTYQLGNPDSSAIEINHPPTIQNQTFYIPDTIKVEDQVGEIIATDEDQGQVLTYSITGGNENDWFVLNSSDGMLSVKNKIEISEDTEAGLKVKVTDNGTDQMSAYATITININHVETSQPVVNHPPVILDQTFNITDTLEVGGHVGEIIATDGDESQVLTYSITGGNENDWFILNFSNGMLSVKNKIEISEDTQAGLEVKVTDNGTDQMSASATITINVKHIETGQAVVNNPPVIHHQEFKKYTNDLKNKHIGVVIASDPDLEQSITYGITDGNTENLFILDENTGELSLNASIQVEPNTSIEYNLTVQVSDNGIHPLSNSAIITVIVIDLGNIVYIDPGNVYDSHVDGSKSHPFSSWKLVEWISGKTYLQKRNTIANENKLDILASNIKLGAYGEGDDPVLVSNTEDFGIRIMNKNNITIQDLLMRAPNSISCLYFFGTCDSINIENCSFKESNYGIRIVGGKSYVIKYSQFENTDYGIYCTADQISAYYNIFTDNKEGINISGTNTKAKIINNVFCSNNIGLEVSNAVKAEVYNSIFYLVDRNDVAFVDMSENLISDNNIYYPENIGFLQIKSTQFNSLETYRSASNFDMYSIIADPLFVDFENKNFKLLPNSPAIDAGKSVGIETDYYGITVPYGNGPDIGLSESNSAITNLEIDLKNDVDQTYLLKVFPNPTNGYFEIDLCNIETMPATLNIINNVGQIVYQDFIVTLVRDQSKYVNIDDYPAGVYTVIVQDNTSTYYQKIIKN
jgi:hypothetical protein